MTEFLLLAADGARSAQASDGWELAIQYIAYGIVIVVSVLILLFIRKRTRLPRHTELKKKLEGLLAEVQELSSPAENRMQFVKRAARALYTADNLAYTAAMLAEKEVGRHELLHGEALYAVLEERQEAPLGYDSFKLPLRLYHCHQRFAGSPV